MAEDSAAERLSPELMREIVYHLIHDWVVSESADRHMNWTFKEWKLTHDAASYAAVSRSWQDIVEHETFAALRLDTHRLSQLNSIVRSPRRRGYVRKIQLDAVLPTYTGESLKLIENDNDKLQNNIALQATVEAFFNSMSSWVVDETWPEGLELSLNAYSRSDEEKSSEAETWRRWPQWGSIWSRRYENSVLELTHKARAQQLPSVQVVTKLSMDNMTKGRRISGNAVAMMLAKLPRARIVSIDWWDAHRDQRLRDEFAEAIRGVTHPIDSFHIAGTSTHPWSLRRPLPASGAPADQKDTLSSALCALSQRLKSLDLYEIAITNEIFWPTALPPSVQGSPHWAKLESLSIYYLPILPTGKWLFRPKFRRGMVQGYYISHETSDSSDSEDETAADAALQRFYEAAGRAALEMPVLRDMTLVAKLEPESDQWHKFWYHVRGGRTARAIWTSSSGFEPTDKVLDLWKQVPMRHVGSELDVKILQDEGAV